MVLQTCLTFTREDKSFHEELLWTCPASDYQTTREYIISLFFKRDAPHAFLQIQSKHTHSKWKHVHLKSLCMRQLSGQAWLNSRTLFISALKPVNVGFVHPHQRRQSDYVNWASGLNDLRQVSSESTQVRGQPLYYDSFICPQFTKPTPSQVITAISVPTRTSERVCSGLLRGRGGGLLFERFEDNQEPLFSKGRGV